jgi:stearoyl-CoA desaturase (delta-9 desaturase)
MQTQQISAPNRGVAAPAVISAPAGVAIALETNAERRESNSRKLIIINLITVLLPFAGLAAAIGLLWGIAFNWYYLWILLGMWAVSSLGITVGFHRLCTHKSFETPAILRYLFAAAGSMAVQGPVIRWCAEHRKHHQHSDTEEDPHSPHMALNGSWGDGIVATLRGAFHAHVGWLFGPSSTGLGKYSRDLREDPAIALADRQFVFWVLFGLAFPAALGGLLSMSWGGVLLGFLWGGLVRILLCHHITWSVNSVCHLWGTKPFDSHDESRNNAIVGVLALGEGWHNNHHAFPTSARHGLRWWELDLSYALIRALQFVGLARQVRTPDAVRIAAKKRTRS